MSTAMASPSSVAQLLDQIQNVGQSYLNGAEANKMQLVAALSKAQREIEGPALYLTRTRLQPLNNMCQLMAIEMGLLDAIVQRNGDPITAAELSQQINRECSLIIRVMRLLLVYGICEETAPTTYRSNAVAAQLNAPEQQGAVRNMVGLMFPIAGRLVPQLRASKGLSQFVDSADDVTPFRATYGSQSMFDYFKTDPELKKAFDGFMAAHTQGKRRHWFDTFPVEERLLKGLEDAEDRTLMVDVAGGVGRDLIAFKNRFPIAAKYVLQDLPSTLENLQPKPDGIELCPHDFFTKQPIEGARTYFFRAIMHDWSDQRCKEILSQTARAMRRGYSKLLIEDMILAEMREGFRGASMDMVMFFLPEGKERTRSEFEQLLNDVGLRIIEVWPGSMGGESVIEAELM